jgi:hypothetical protein
MYINKENSLMRKTTIQAAFVRHALNHVLSLNKSQEFTKLAALLLLIPGLFGSLAGARVTHIQIISREVVANGMPFGSSGAYEKLRGRVLFEVDPEDPRNAVVFDLDKAPQNHEGMVEFSADMFILKPMEIKKGSNRSDPPENAGQFANDRLL